GRKRPRAMAVVSSGPWGPGQKVEGGVVPQPCIITPPGPGGILDLRFRVWVTRPGPLGRMGRAHPLLPDHALRPTPHAPRSISGGGGEGEEPVGDGGDQEDGVGDVHGAAEAGDGGGPVLDAGVAFEEGGEQVADLAQGPEDGPGGGGVGEGD